MGSGKVLNQEHKYPNINMTSNVFDRTSIKSFYLLVSGHFDLKYDELIKLKKSILKTIIENLDRELFRVDYTIDVEEIRMSSVYSYVGCEYTIFLLKENSMKIEELEKETKMLMDVIYDTHFNKPKFRIKCLSIL